MTTLRRECEFRFVFFLRVLDEWEDRFGIFGVSREKCIFNLIKGKFRFDCILLLNVKKNKLDLKLLGYEDDHYTRNSIFHSQIHKGVK